jgi:hypothetical protein
VTENQALIELTCAVREAPVLMPPNHSKPFSIVTDSSDYAVGCSLEQIDEHSGNRRPVTYLSQTLNTAERSYPTHERELLAIVIALRTWRQLLLGSEFSVISQIDHRLLQAFLAQATLSARQVRWQKFLSEVNLQITYLPGKALPYCMRITTRFTRPLATILICCFLFVIFVICVHHSFLLLQRIRRCFVVTEILMCDCTSDRMRWERLKSLWQEFVRQ